jgi:hypothetical protein
MALLEAKALGVPFATFDVGGNRELTGASDRVVARGDLSALAAAAVELLGFSGKEKEVWDVRAQNERALDQWTRVLG